jgi:hypothetical protein
MADEKNTDVRWSLAQRLEFIEWRAYWTGRVNRKDLEDEFDISTPQASVDLRTYQETAPGNIAYDSSGKTYLTTADFRPRYMKLSPERYLLQLHAISTGAVWKRDTWFEELPPVDVMPAIVRGPEAYVLRAVVRAIESRSALPIYYRSLTSTGMRTICPHALVHDGYRWHARAWSVEREQFRDYVLGRILSFSESKPFDVDVSRDVQWQTTITLRLTAHPGLSAEQRETIEHDYRLDGGELKITMRLALAYYFIVRHNLDLRGDAITPERAQLFVQNFDEYESAMAASREATSERRTQSAAARQA